NPSMYFGLVDRSPGPSPQPARSPASSSADMGRSGSGATVAMLETASGQKAFSVGKPSPVMLRAARKELALPTDQTVVIGDTMDTDILGGVQLNYKTILVLSGSTRREDLPRYAYRPEMIVESIADLDPANLEREFGVEFNSDFTSLHPSHRARRKPASAQTL